LTERLRSNHLTTLIAAVSDENQQAPGFSWQNWLNWPGAVPPDDGVVVLPPPPPVPPPPVPPLGGCAPPEGVVLGAWGVAVPLPVPPLEGVPPPARPVSGVVVVGTVGVVASGIEGAVSPPGTVRGGGAGVVSALSSLPPPHPATAKPNASRQISRERGLMGERASALLQEGAVRSAGSR
jgi:hypothetical protein